MSRPAPATPSPTGTPLDRLLSQASISDSELGHALGVARGSVWRWRAGTCAPPRARRARLQAWLRERGLTWSEPLFPVAIAAMSDTPVDLEAERNKRVRRTRPARAPAPQQETEIMETTSREYLDEDELAHFHLARDPFEDAEDPEDVYMPPRLAGIERSLLAAIQRRQVVALVGDPGSGKSTLLRRLYAKCEREKRIRLIAPASLDRRRITHAALCVAILRDVIGRETSSMSMEARDVLLRQTLSDSVAAGQYPVLLIDEAHQLKNDALLALKQLWDSHTLFRQIAVLLVGQLPLRARLKEDPAVRELTGRTRIITLDRMGDDTGDYLRWRLSRVDGDADRLFDAGAMKAIAQRGECPLWINNVAVLAMRYAAQLGDDRVTSTHVGRL